MSAKRDEASRELDAKIAVDVMDWTLTAPVEEGCDHSVGTYRDGSSAKRNFVRDTTGKEHPLPRFSSDIAVAWLVVEKMRAERWQFAYEWEDGHWAAFYRSAATRADMAIAESAPLCICLAALAALSERAS